MHIASWSQQIIATFLSVVSGTRVFEFILQKQVTLNTTTFFFLGHKVEGCHNTTISNTCAYSSINDEGQFVNPSLLSEHNSFRMLLFLLREKV